METGSVVVLSFCVGAPCPFCPVWKKLFGPMCQGVEDTLFSCNVVVAVPMLILICVGGFPINCGAEGAVRFYGDKTVQEWK